MREEISLQLGDIEIYKIRLFPEINTTYHNLMQESTNDYVDILALTSSNGSANDKTYTEIILKIKAKKPGEKVKIPLYIVKQYTNISHQLIDKYIEILPSYKITATSNIVCGNENSSYTIKELEDTPGAKVTWQASKNCTLISGQGTKTGIFKTSGNGSTSVKVNIEYKGKNYVVENNDVWVGPPTIPVKLTGRTGEQTFMADMVYPFEVKEQQDATEFLWYPNSGTITKTELGTRRISVLMPTPPRPGFHGVFDMYIATKNKCGTSKPYWAEIIGTVKDGNPGGIGIIPKPIDPFSLKSSSVPTTDIRIYSFNTGSLVYQERGTVEFSIENTTLKPGIYVVESTDSEGTVTKTKVMKK